MTGKPEAIPLCLKSHVFSKFILYKVVVSQNHVLRALQDEDANFRMADDPQGMREAQFSVIHHSNSAFGAKEPPNESFGP
jgi:hypothetical protein